MKALVTDAELELLQETVVIHHIEGREDVETFLSEGNKSIYCVMTRNTPNLHLMHFLNEGDFYADTLTDLARTSVSSMRLTGSVAVEAT